MTRSAKPRRNPQTPQSPSHPQPQNSSHKGGEEDLASGETDTERLVFFSDAVIAIAITLLVLDIHVPPVEQLQESGRTLTSVLLAKWPSYLSYAISFVVIGETWANHHTMFRYIRRANHPLILINTLFLMFLAFIPFSAALMAEYIETPEKRVAVFVYGAVLTIGGLFYNLIWIYAARHPRLLIPDMDPAQVRVMRNRYLLGPVFYAVAALMAFISVPVSLGVYISLMALFVLPGPNAPTKKPRRSGTSGNSPHETGVLPSKAETETNLQRKS